MLIVCSKRALKFGGKSKSARGDDEGINLCMAQSLSSMSGSLMPLYMQASEVLGPCSGQDTE